MIRKFIYKYLWWTYRPLKNLLITRQHKKDAARLDTLMPADQRIFYLGITNQPNLGDMGQHYCIKKWIEGNYPNFQLVMFEGDTIVNPKSGFIKKFKAVYRPNDIVIFQSGYCTQDLGGNHPLMHRLIIDAVPHAKILMMPQTIYFQHEENRRICAENHNKAKNMLFLARDYVSFDMAKKMFPDIKVMAFPDIVTTLIGTFAFNNPRKGVCLCTRNDGEKLYSDEQIAELAIKIQAEGTTVVVKDTQGKRPYKEIRSNLRYFIEKEIESYSYFVVTITDRYHGTIFSLCAGTPVIIVKTTDHKVTTGADWFRGVYDDYVYVAEDLEDAYRIYKGLTQKKLTNTLNSYFKIEYYDKLKNYLS